MNFRPNPSLARILRWVQLQTKSPIYLVGGSLRDALLRRPTTDLDLAVLGSAETLARKLARAIRGTFVVLDERLHVYRVVLPQNSEHKPWTQIDIAQVQGKDIHADLSRRDFTINSMAWAINGDNGLLDPRGGLRDLKRRIIRADRPIVFPEDPLRLLRAYRQAAQLEFKLDPTTQRHIRKYHRLVRKPAGERIHQELLGVFASSQSNLWAEQMDATGILTTLFPEMEKSRRCAILYYGQGGVLRHALATLARIDFLFLNLNRILPNIAKEVQAYLKEQLGSLEHAQSLLRLAALLHDIAKPATAKKVEGRLRFFAHDTIGAKKVATLLEGLRFSKQEIELIASCIRHHLRPGNLAANAVISNKAVFRFFQDVGNYGVPLLLVCWADHASYLSPAALQRVLPHTSKDPHQFRLDSIRDTAIRKTLHHLQVVGFLLQSYFRRRERILPTALLDGHAIMKALKIPPGPSVGKALELLQEAQAEGKVSTRSEALQFLKKSPVLKT